MKRLYTSQEWRLENLYKILDENGLEITFKMNEAQREFWLNNVGRDAILKARQLGFSTFIAILILDDSIFLPNTRSGIVDVTLADAEAKLAKIKFAYDRLPEWLRDQVQLVKANDREIEFSNGSIVTVGISHRGGTLQNLHVSEFGKVSVDKPKHAKEIINGAFKAAHAGRIFVESTAHGTSGEFYDLVQRAEAAKKTGLPLTRLDFGIRFYGWWIKPEYRIANNLVVIPAEKHVYFAEVEARMGIRLDADQRAWYVKQEAELGPDDMKSEFPSTPEEAFFASLEGAFWKREMSKARAEKRIGFAVPHDPTRRVNTTWDIGEDCTAIIFHQTDGLRHRIIDYHEEEGGSLQSSAGVVWEKAHKRGFIFDKHYGPHDLENKEWGHNAEPRTKVAEGLGIKFTVIKRIEHKEDSIEAGRRMLALTWIDQEHAKRVVECFDAYSKKWNDRMAMWSAEPLHNWASHCSDAWQQIAMGLIPPRPDTARSRGRGKPEGSTAWSA